MSFGIWLATVLWLSSAVAAPSVDLSGLPSKTRSLIFIDLFAAADSELLKPLQDQLVKASGLEKDLEQFLFLSGMDLSKEANQVALCKVSSESEKLIPVGLITGSFSEKTTRAIELSQRLMQEREYRVVQIDEGQVLFGSAEAVKLYLETGEKLGPETVRTLQTLKSQGPIFGWMHKGWLGEHIPEDFTLGPNPEWSLIWARDQISLQSFTASVSSPLQFSLTAAISDPKAAIVLQDELQGYFLHLTRWEKEGDLKAALEKTRFSRDGGHLNMDLELPEKALEEFGGKNGFTGILNWQNRVSRREGWQKVVEIFKAADLKAGDQVADVGAGRGFLSVRLARMVGESGRVWAVDIDSEQLDEVRERAESAPYPQLTAVVGEVDDPKLPQGRLDALFIINSYHEMKEYEAMLEHFRGALKPQGKLVVIHSVEQVIAHRLRSRDDLAPS